MFIGFFITKLNNKQHHLFQHMRSIGQPDWSRLFCIFASIYLHTSATSINLYLYTIQDSYILHCKIRVFNRNIIRWIEWEEFRYSPRCVCSAHTVEYMWKMNNGLWIESNSVKMYASLNMYICNGVCNCSYILSCKKTFSRQNVYIANPSTIHWQNEANYYNHRFIYIYVIQYTLQFMFFFLLQVSEMIMYTQIRIWRLYALVKSNRILLGKRICSSNWSK